MASPPTDAIPPDVLRESLLLLLLAAPVSRATDPWELIGRIVESGTPASFSAVPPETAAEGPALPTRLGHPSALVLPSFLLGRSVGAR